MNKRVLTLFGMLAILSLFKVNALFAESFQFEGSGIYQYEKSDDSKSSIYILDGSVYFDQVNTDGKLLNEAAFMQKIGYIDFFGMYGKIEESGIIEMTPAGGGFDLCVVLPEPLFVMAGASYTRITGDFDLKMTDAALNCGLGYFIQDGLALSVLYQRDLIKIDASFIPKTKATSNAITGNIKFVTMFENNMGINLEGLFTYTSVDSESDTETGKEYEIGGDLYLTQAISVGGACNIVKTEDSTDSEKTYSARIKAFVIQAFAITVGYDLTKPDDGSSDTKSYRVMLTGRI